MTSKATTKATSAKTSRKSSPQQSRKNSRKHSLQDSVMHSVKKSSRINRQRRLQKQLQVLLLERHSRRCIICHHPEREAIEEEFVHWRAPWKLSQDYKLNDYRTVYRHARAAGLLLQRRERLHSALDAFVESVDDVTFTGDTILRAMRAYSCIDSHGRWTEIPTQVQFSTSTDAHPPQPSPRTSNVASDVIDINTDEEPEDEEDALEERVTALDVLNVIRKYSNQAPRSDATSCAKSSAQASSVTEDEYDKLEDDDSDADEESEEGSEEGSEEDAENALEEFVTSLSTSSKSSSPSDNTACSTSPKSTSRSDTTACAVPPAQAVSVSDFENDPDNEDDPDDDPDDDDVPDNDPKNKSEADRLEKTTACAAPPAQSAVALGSNHRGRTVTATACASSKTRSRSDATACADSPAQALPRDVVRGQNPNDRSPSDRTDCPALPSGGAPLQPAAPAKPKPDADGFIWHPRPGYPDQEISEPDAQGRVAYKIHMMTTAAQLPSRKMDAQRAAKLIYGSVIKKYGNP